MIISNSTSNIPRILDDVNEVIEKYFSTPFDSDNPAVLAKRVNKDNNVK